MRAGDQKLKYNLECPYMLKTIINLHVYRRGFLTYLPEPVAYHVVPCLVYHHVHHRLAVIYLYNKTCSPIPCYAKLMFLRACF